MEIILEGIMRDSDGKVTAGYRLIGVIVRQGFRMVWISFDFSV